MKDYLHLFGGMGAAIVALAIYIFAFGAVMRCFAEERITYPASDGVNEVTARVRDDGVVIPESVTLAYVEPPPREKVTETDAPAIERMRDLDAAELTRRGM